MNEALEELSKLIENLNDESEKPALRDALMRVRNEASDVMVAKENIEEALGQTQAKNAELWTELNALRREAEQGFEYYPGPSSHCVMCEAVLVVQKDNEPKEKAEGRVARGLCDKCKPDFDQLHPGARENPKARPEANLTAV